MNQDMELWKQMFQELIQEVKPWHIWTLTVDKDLLPNSLKPGWSQYQQWAFARFQCSLCSRSWASAQVQVLFHMHKSGEKPKGRVKMRVFAQRCQRCNQSPFEVPEFTEENISRILNNLVFRILKKCYREGFKSMEEIPTIKEISLKGTHDSNNCEACLQGFCAQSGSGEALQLPVLPSLPAVSLPALGTAIPMPSPTRSGAPANTVKGNTRADTVKGNTRADTVKGSTPADTVKGNTRADTVKGNTRAEAVKGNTRAEAVKENAMRNKGKALPQPRYTVSTKAAILPTHWSSRPNTHHHMERRIQVSTWTEVPFCHTVQNLRCRDFNVCCCVFILIIVVVIIVETIQWTST
ncbi:PREDICTED: receptor-transporting protein 3 [Odobenus rosmarus divergens]|uniref:Receptor-transporting protein 3 n=1 Tax=Odobenus rosmarus divergens TaxID=9708 RepID=A0A2U3VVH8_ODORO|nr:PREDICTED: receptor-transporting protein 3 [Odobenus rosmarus divergens]